MRFHLFHIFSLFLFSGSFIVIPPGFLFSQDVLPDTLPRVRWEHAGVYDSVPTYSRVVNILDAGADASGVTSNTIILEQLLLELSGSETIIFFPEGDYLFSEPITIRDRIILRGEGQGKTKLIFDFQGQNHHAISVLGSMSNESFPIQSDIKSGDQNITISNLELDPNETVWAYLQFKDSVLMASSWAYGTAGGLYELTSMGGNDYISKEAFRRSISSDENPTVRLITPVSGVGLECFSVLRLDSTAQQTSNIVFDNTVNCWIVGVESKWCNFAHVDIRRSSNILIRGNYFHEAHAYRGGGQGYGVVLQFGSTLCLVDNNIFRKLRHSMLLQAGAQANVLAYNYSKEAYWTQGGLPEDSAGDLVLHGNYSYLNLFEGNIVQNIVIDASHGQNGPHNYFLRNRAELYGIFMSPGSETDSTHFIGNEVISTTFLQGFYSLIGLGNFEYGNRVRGMIRPEGTLADLPESLYLYQRPGFWDTNIWPHIGEDDLILSSINPAKLRYDLLEFTDCRTNPTSSSSSLDADNLQSITINIYPNPAYNQIYVKEKLSGQVWGFIYSSSGPFVKSTGMVDSQSPIDISSLPAGAYILILIDEKAFFHKAVFIKQ